MKYNDLVNNGSVVTPEPTPNPKPTPNPTPTPGDGAYHPTSDRPEDGRGFADMEDGELDYWYDRGWYYNTNTWEWYSPEEIYDIENEMPQSGDLYDAETDATYYHDLSFATAESVNAMREKYGKKPLKYSASLQKIADQRAYEATIIRATEKYDTVHYRPDGSSAHTIFSDANYVKNGKFSAQHSENAVIKTKDAFEHEYSIASAKELAISYARDWEDSPGHKDNMLQDNWETTAVGICNANGYTVIMQIFTSADECLVYSQVVLD